jgi:hypothetical protein
MVEKHKIGLVNAFPLHMRILTEQGAPEWHPAPAEIREAGGKVAKWVINRTWPSGRQENQDGTP